MDRPRRRLLVRWWCRRRDPRFVKASWVRVVERSVEVETWVAMRVEAADRAEVRAAAAVMAVVMAAAAMEEAEMVQGVR